MKRTLNTIQKQERKHLLIDNIGRSPTLLTMLCSSIGLDDIEAVCSQAYDHLDNISSVEFVLVSSLVYYVFEESCMLALAPELIAEYQTHAQLCKENIDTGLANLPLLLPSTVQNVQGLLLGVGFPLFVPRLLLRVILLYLLSFSNIWGLGLCLN